MSLASSSGDRLSSVPGAGAVRAVPWTGASFARGKWSGIGNVGCSRHPSKKYYTRQGQDLLFWARLRYYLPGAGFVQS